MLAALALMIAIVTLHTDRQQARNHLMLTLPPDDVASHADLVRAATAEARPVYADHCARCHGSNLRGDAAAGTPDLVDAHWLYGSGRVSDIERTILFGIRSGNGKARNVAEMPAFGQTGLLQPAEIQDIVSYLRSRAHHAANADAVARGQALYFDKGGCVDCHGADARGNPDYGAPDLTARTATTGSPAALARSIFFGRHNICPAWDGILSLRQIRALAVYLHAAGAAKAAA